MKRDVNSPLAGPTALNTTGLTDPPRSAIWGGTGMASPTPPPKGTPGLGGTVSRANGGGWQRGSGTGAPLRSLYGQPQTKGPAFGGGANPYGAPTPGAPGSPENKVGFGGNTAPTTSPWGTESGPTAIEDRYYQRANGTDPGWEYAVGRGEDAINRQYAARGGYNSSGAMNSLDDMYANAVSQREGQLDTLANEATGAHQRKLEDMFNEGDKIASGKSGIGSTYDQLGGGAMTQEQQNELQFQLTKMGYSQAQQQQIIAGIFGILGVGGGALGKIGG